MPLTATVFWMTPSFDAEENPLQENNPLNKIPYVSLTKKDFHKCDEQTEVDITAKQELVNRLVGFLKTGYIFGLERKRGAAVKNTCQARDMH